MRECFCLTQFNVGGWLSVADIAIAKSDQQVKTCSVQNIYKTSDVEENDPKSLVCPRKSVNVFSKCLCAFLATAQY